MGLMLLNWSETLRLTGHHQYNGRERHLSWRSVASSLGKDGQLLSICILWDKGPLTSSQSSSSPSSLLVGYHTLGSQFDHPGSPDSPHSSRTAATGPQVLVDRHLRITPTTFHYPSLVPNILVLTGVSSASWLARQLLNCTP